MTFLKLPTMILITILAAVFLMTLVTAACACAVFVLTDIKELEKS